MNTTLLVITAILVLPVSYANAEEVPQWVKNNAGWWAQDAISESEFILAIQHLIDKGIMTVQPAAAPAQQTEGIPDWVKGTALWWSQGDISDGEFVNAIRHLISLGVITIQTADDPELDTLQSNLAACSEITKAYQRSECTKTAKAALVAHDYKTNGESVQVGPVTFYYQEYDLEISSSGQAILNIVMLAENSGSDQNVTMMCTGPSICNYDVWDGDRSFKYAGMDFTNGQIVLQPGLYREFSMLFGPNIGYGGTKFEYDPSKEYFFRVSEPWGDASMQLQLHTK